MRKAPLCELEPLQGEASGRGVIDARGVRGVRGVTPREPPRGVADISLAPIILGDGCADISPASITRGGGCGIDCAIANKRFSLDAQRLCAAVGAPDEASKTPTEKSGEGAFPAESLPEGRHLVNSHPGWLQVIVERAVPRNRNYLPSPPSARSPNFTALPTTNAPPR